MHPNGHLAISVIGSAAIFTFLKDIDAAIAFFLANFFIDIDHVFDYFLNNGVKFFRPRDLLNWSYNIKIKKTTLVFHSFEFIFIFWVVIAYFELGSMWIAGAFGLTIHLVIDQFVNSGSALSYFLSYRLIKGFKGEDIFPGREY